MEISSKLQISSRSHTICWDCNLSEEGLLEKQFLVKSSLLVQNIKGLAKAQTGARSSQN